MPDVRNIKHHPFYNELARVYPLRLEMMAHSGTWLGKARVWWVATVMLIKHALPTKLRARPMGLPIDGWGTVWVTDRSEYRVAHEIFHRDIYRVDGLPERATTILDLGANIGLAARYFAGVYPEAKIISYEPDPVVAERARRNVSGLNVEVRTGAISGSDGTITLHRQPSDSWGTGEYGEGAPFITSATSLQSLIAECAPVDVLKLDIEGSEYDAIERCANLTDAAVIVGELHPVPGRDMDGFFDRLIGFRLVEKFVEWGNCTFVAVRDTQAA